MTNSVNVQPDITLRLDPSGVIRRAVVSATIANEDVAAKWVGQRWTDTLVEGNALVHQLLDDKTGGSTPRVRVRQRLGDGRELEVEYTTVRLGGAGLIAIGHSLEATRDVEARLNAAKASMERDAWKLRDVETRYRLLFDALTNPVLLIDGDLRVVEANAAADRALGVSNEADFLAQIDPAQRPSFRTMLERLHEQGRVPGIVLNLGSRGLSRAWLVRATLVAEWAPVFLVQLLPANPVVEEVAPPAHSTTQLSKAAMNEVVANAVSSVEQACIAAALNATHGDRGAVARLMGISEEALAAKLSTTRK